MENSSFESLYRVSQALVRRIDTEVHRYLYDKINWDAELNMILGCRGVGKTTMMLQHIILAGEQRSSLYVSAENPYFSTHRLYRTAYGWRNTGSLQRHRATTSVHLPG